MLMKAQVAEADDSASCRSWW